MRVVWIVGGHEDVRLQFEKQLASELYDGLFVVRQTEDLGQIPAEHLANPGVVMCVDAFHSELGGFEGIRKLRGLGFSGAIFLFGEPAPESASTLWEELNIAGFLPPFERLDVPFAAGLIYYRLSFEGSVNAAKFLAVSGRASSEVLHSVAELNAFATKLASFVGRFGVDLQQLKKVIMGLTLPHIKVTSKGPSVDPAFTIVYGLDPTKLVLGVGSYSRGASRAVLRHEMVTALHDLQESRNPVSSILPEVHHVVRATRNVVVFSGHAKVEAESTDPLFVLTTLLFRSGAGAAKSESHHYHATLGFVGPTPEMTELEAFAEVGVTASPQAAVIEPDESETAPSHSAPHQDQSLDRFDLEKILAEPRVVGDAPVDSDAVVARSTIRAPEGDPVEGEAYVGGPADRRSDSELAREVERLKAVCAAMNFDLKRLLRERREPTTDKELRESYRDLDEKCRRLNQERTTLQERLEEREKQVELLKAQLEALRKTAA